MIEILAVTTTIIVILHNATVLATVGLSNLSVAFQWKYLDWIKPAVSLTGKNFTLGNPLTQDVDVDAIRNRIFVTCPHWLEGTPITLSTVTMRNGPGGPLLKPYPNWKWHKLGCDGIVSVFRVAIDECNRLWIVDNGNIGRKSVCPKKILIFDLRTDKLLHKYVIPENQTFGGSSQLVTPIVDVGSTCADSHLYVADVKRHGLFVFSLKENRLWRWNNSRSNRFGYEQNAVDFNIAGEYFELRDGILGMSLSPKGLFHERYLYFNSMTSYYQKFTDANTLKNSNLTELIVYQSTRKRISQAGPQATSRTGAIFFQLAQMTALACWNIQRPFNLKNVVIIAQHEEQLQYISGIKVIINTKGQEELWFNTNRLQKTIKGTRKKEEINFRIFRGLVNELIKDTNCESTAVSGIKPNLDSWLRI